jgi:hypothetical protein
MHTAFALSGLNRVRLNVFLVIGLNLDDPLNASIDKFLVHVNPVSLFNKENGLSAVLD